MLWNSNSRTQIDAKRAALRSALLHGKEWGKSTDTTIVYATGRAFCRLDAESEWVGGAHFISGDQTHTLVWLDRPGSNLLRDYFERQRFTAIAQSLLDSYTSAGGPSSEPHPIVKLDGPQLLAWDAVDWLSDTKLCLGRQEGRLMATAAITLHTMSARSASWSIAAGTASEVLGWGEQSPHVELEALRRALPQAKDVFVAPGAQVIVVQGERGLTVYGPSDVVEGWAGSVRTLLTLEGELSPVVAVEWANGAPAARWIKELGLAPSTR